MTTPDSIGPGGATSTGAGGLAAGPGDDQGESPVIREAEQGRPERSPGPDGTPAAEGGLAAGGETGPDLTGDDERTAADRGERPI
jgi:hypothetical protein